MTSKSPEAVARVRKGEALLDNLRTDEAAKEFSAALEIDPALALAHAYHGQATPGPDGLKEIESAAAAAKEVTEPERLIIDGILAVRRGENGSAVRALTRLTEVEPRYSRGHYLLGATLLNQQKYAEASAALKKAVDLDASNGGAQNMLGYTALRQGDADGAAAAFSEYARLLPQEPNAQDSLGEALLAGGRFKEAEAAFQKALELSPEFWNAHEGMAFARFYAGDWAGGRDALMKAKAGAERRSDKLGIDMEMSAVALAQNNPAEALKTLDTAQQTPGAQPAETAFIPVRRAQVLLFAGRARDALAPLAEAITLADSGQLPPGLTRNLRREALRTRIAAEAALGDAAAAQKTSSALDVVATSRPDDADAQSAMHFGRGLLALASKDLAGARAHFDQCSMEDEWCRAEAVNAAAKAGDTAGAASARDRLLKLYARDPLHLIIRSRHAPPKTT